MEQLEKSGLTLTALKDTEKVLKELTGALISSSIVLPNVYETNPKEDSNPLLAQIQRIRRCAVELLNANKSNVKRKRQLSKKDTNRIRGPPPKKSKNSAADDLKIHCYICKQPFSESLVPHTFYKSMCSECGNLNYTKRCQTRNLTGKVALVTGGRVKIGLETALKLLRCNCKFVIVTTRFPVNAARVYASQKDYHEWKDRLHIYELDMRFLGKVQQFCDHVKETYGRLDILIQNAAQTIRKPSRYYRDIAENKIEGEIEEMSVIQVQPTENTLVVPRHVSALVHPEDILYEEDNDKYLADFPGTLDEDKQPIDLRRENTWILQLDKVHSVELVEVTAVNYLAPYIILKAFTDMLKPKKEGDDCSFVVMVSAMEGKFYHQKPTRHPHTNAAKAAINMLVHTSASYYWKMNIVLVAVETGWITDEYPFGSKIEGFIPPLDSVDGAARILDPIMTNDGTVRGKFLKDYKPTSW